VEVKINTNQAELEREWQTAEGRGVYGRTADAESPRGHRRYSTRYGSHTATASKAQLAAEEARTRRAGGGNAGANADEVKPPKFDGSKSWAVFYRQFEAAAIHND
jgi:hypothetical protein